MEFVEVSPTAIDSYETDNEVIDNAIGDARKKRIAARKAKAEKRVKASLVKKPTTRRAKRKVAKAKKVIRKAPSTLAKIEKRQERREEIKKGLKRASFAPLIPLKPVMSRALQRKGVATKKMKIDELSKRFYNDIVVKQTGETYEPVTFEPDVDYIDPITITAVVSAIVGFVKSLRRKKQEGEKLSTLQNEIVEGSDAVQAQLELEQESEQARTIGRTFIMEPTTLLIIGAVVVAVILFARK